MDLGIAGRTAVVTGASKGIGAATAARLAAEGARVVGVSRGETGIDVTAADAAERIAELAGGAVDILVNNAGTSWAKPLEDLTDEDWNAQWALNVLAPLHLMQAFAPGMAQRGWGRVVNVASSAGKRPSLTNAAYSVTKSAELSLSRVFADSYAGTGVLVNAVAPGATASGLWIGEGGLADQTAAARGVSREEAIAIQESKVPLGRFATPEEIADVIVFLCSERASTVAGAAWSVERRYGARDPLMSWLPENFEHPERVDLPTGHHLRPIRADDVDIDYPAVMGSRERLWAKYGEAWGWPPETMTREADREDLAHHEEEIAAHETFNYAVLNDDESALLGCVYIDPADDRSPEGAQAVVSWWVVDEFVGSELERELDAFVPRWLADTWQFSSVDFSPD